MNKWMDYTEKGFFHWKAGPGNFHGVSKFCNSLVIDLYENFILKDFYHRYALGYTP